MRALIFVHSSTKFVVDGDIERTEPLKRFKLGGKYAAQETEVALSPGSEGGELARGIYATCSDGATEAHFRAGESARAGDYDIVILGDGKDEWPSILKLGPPPDESAESVRIRDCAEYEGVTSDAQLKEFFGDLQI